MGTPFWKMHGAGNDFILIDDRSCSFPDSDTRMIAALCTRRTGIGSEGLILIRPSTIADFRMRFFNPDGGEVDMCGNGARCVSRLAYDLGITKVDMTIETRAGLLSASIQGDSVKLMLPAPHHFQKENRLTLPGGESINYAFLNTGVPHVVIMTDALENYPVKEHGRAIRQHADFAPEGTNVNFVASRGTGTIDVRTYERGVEDETLACGTGIVASAIAAAALQRVAPPVTVHAASGDTLYVDFHLQADSITQVSLTGPAVYVCTGSF